MNQPPSEGMRDTTLYRIARNVGFNARVEPFWHTFSRLQTRMGFFERWREKRRLKGIVRTVDGSLKNGAEGGDWHRRAGECVCNLRVAKMGLVAEFKSYLRQAEIGALTHIQALRDGNCYIIPPAFDRPLSLPMKTGETVAVTSARKLSEELAEVNGRLKIDETFAIKKMVDYLDATERDISIYESRFGTYEGFWAKFTYVLIKKLTDVSLQQNLPAIVA